MRFLFTWIKTTACELYLVHSAVSFAAKIGVKCVSKIFQDDQKTSPNSNCDGHKHRVFKASGGRKGKTVMLHFNDAQREHKKYDDFFEIMGC